MSSIYTLQPDNTVWTEVIVVTITKNCFSLAENVMYFKNSHGDYIEVR